MGCFQQPEETTSVSEDYAAMEKILQDGPVANSDAEAELRALLAPDSSARQLVPVVDTMSESLSDWLGSAKVRNAARPPLMPPAALWRQ